MTSNVCKSPHLEAKRLSTFQEESRDEGVWIKNPSGPAMTGLDPTHSLFIFVVYLWG